MFTEKGILQIIDVPRNAKIGTHKIISLLQACDSETKEPIQYHTLYFKNCQSLKVYKFIFDFFMTKEAQNEGRYINTILFDNIEAETLLELCKNAETHFFDALNCESMSRLKELILIMDDFDNDNQLMGNMITQAGDLFLSHLSSKCANILKNSIEYLKFNNFFCQLKSKADVYLHSILLQSGINHLKILDLRNMRLNGKQNRELANSLSLLVAPRDRKKKNKNKNNNTNSKNKNTNANKNNDNDNNKNKMSKIDHKRQSSNLFLEKSMFSLNYRCSIEQLYIGGNDEWDANGIELLCNFIRYNGNLEIVGIDCRQMGRSSTLLNKVETSTMSLLILALNQHPSLYRLELYRIKPFVLVALSEQWERRCKNIRISELYVDHVPEEGLTGPRDNLVLPAVARICANTPWLQFLELKMGIYFGHNDIAQLCTIINNCYHLSGILFDARSTLNPDHRKMIVNKLAKTVKNKDIKENSVTMVDAIYSVMCQATGIQNATKDLASLILSFADVSFAHNAGILLLDTNILNKRHLPIQDTKPLIESLLANWKKLPFGGIYYHDQRYMIQRTQLLDVNQKIQAIEAKQMKKTKNDDGKDDQSPDSQS